MIPEELSEDARRMLGLAMQILEDLPEWLQPASNMADMRTILAGGYTGRDELIISEAVATALAWRTQQATAHPIVDNEPGFNNRLHEWESLFGLIQLCDAQLCAISYNQACNRIALAGREPHGRRGL